MTDYALMKRQLGSLIGDTEWDVSILSNASALIWEALDDINWAGFYIMRNGRLELGPFQGKVACVSEIVIPIHVNGEVYGVLDIDSPVKDRFSEEDQSGLEALVMVIEEKLGTLSGRS